jgi:hypothetical protein
MILNQLIPCHFVHRETYFLAGAGAATTRLAKAAIAAQENFMLKNWKIGRK